MVSRNGELNRWRPVFQPEANGKTCMINGVVFIAKELLAAAQNVNCIGLQVDIQAKLAVVSYTGLLTV